MKRSREKTPSSRLVNSDRHSTMVFSLFCSHFLSCATLLPASSSSASASPSFPKLRPFFSMFRIFRSVPDPRTGRIILIRIQLSEINSDRSSELSAHQISLGSSLGLFFRAERSSNLCPNSPRTRSSELSTHQILVRTHLGQSLRAERSSNNCSKVIWNPMLQLSSLLSPFFRNVSSTGFCLRPLRHIWAEPADRFYSERSAHYWLGSVGVRAQPGSTSGQCLSLRVLFYEGNLVDSAVTCRTHP